MQKDVNLKAENDQHVLIQLGLTSQQAKVYLALSKFQQASVQEISNCVGIDKSEVYRATLELHKLGLIEKMISKPVKYSIVSVEAGIHFLIKRKKCEDLSLEQKAKELIKLNSPKKSIIEPNPRENISYAYRSETYSSKKEELYRKTKSSIDIITNLERERKLNPHYKALRNLAKKGIKFRVIIEVPYINEETRQRMRSLLNLYNNAFPFRITTRKIAMPLGIFDKKEVLLYISETTNYTEASLVHTNNPRIVNLVTEYFENLWEKGEEIRLIERD